jgi:hypothetical protein
VPLVGDFATHTDLITGMIVYNNSYEIFEVSKQYEIIGVVQ